MKRLLHSVWTRIEAVLIGVVFVLTLAVMSLMEKKNPNRDPFDIEERYD